MVEGLGQIDHLLKARRKIVDEEHLPKQRSQGFGFRVSSFEFRVSGFGLGFGV